MGKNGGRTSPDPVFFRERSNANLQIAIDDILKQFLTPFPPLAKDVGDDVAVDVGQSEVSSGVTVR